MKKTTNTWKPLSVKQKTLITLGSIALGLIYLALILTSFLIPQVDKLSQFIVSDVLGVVAFGFIMFAIWPQFVRVVITKDTQSISLWMYILYIFGDSVWVIFDFGFIFYEIVPNFNNGTYEDTPLSLALLPQVFSIISNSIGVFIGVYIVFFKSKNLWMARQLNLTERQYSEQMANVVRKHHKIERVLLIILIGLFAIAFGLVLGYLAFDPYATSTRNGGQGDWISVQWVNIISWIGTLIWIVVLIPQFLKTVITRDTYSLSVYMYLFMLTSSLVWVTFDIANLFASHSLDIYAEIACDGSSFLCSLIIFIFKLIYMIKAYRKHTDEKTYWKLYVAKKRMLSKGKS